MENAICEEVSLLIGRTFLIVKELEQVVFSFKRDKAPRPYGLQAKVFQKMFNYIGDGHCLMHDASRKEGYLPKKMSTSLIVLIPPKGGDKLEIKSYRPFTMPNTTSKCYEYASHMGYLYLP